jgi:hypothetical protein
MSGDWIIIKTLKDMKPKISRIWNKNPLINLDESHIIYRPMRIFEVVGICMERLYSWGQYYKQLKCPFEAPQYPW